MKFLSVLRWLGAMLIALVAFILPKILYPLIYPYHRFEWSNKKPLWYFWDDEDGIYGAQYWREAKGITKYNFWVSYRWCALRNPMWNLHTKLVPIRGDEYYISMKGKLLRNQEADVPLYKVAVLMYVNDDGSYLGNSGDNLSLKYSILGRTFLWFKIKNRLYWRYSFAGKIINWNFKITNFFGRVIKFPLNLWLEVQLGTGYRHTFRVKLKLNPNIN